MSDYTNRTKREEEMKLVILAALLANRPEGDVMTEAELSSLQSQLSSDLVAPIDGIIDDTIKQLIDDYQLTATAEEIKAKLDFSAADKASELAQQITDHTREALAGQELTDDVLESIMGDIRANVIAVTETTAINCAVVVAAATALGSPDLDPTTLVWRTSEDDAVCEECEPKDGQPIADVDIPPEHPNCRCWIEQAS